MISSNYSPGPPDFGGAWTHGTTEELIEFLKKNKPSVYKQMQKQNAIDPKMSQFDLFSLVYSYELAINYGTGKIKIDYSLLPKEEIAEIMNKLIDEIPAFEKLIDEMNCDARVTEELNGDIKKMKLHFLKLGNLLKMQLKKSEQSNPEEPNTFGA